MRSPKAPVNDYAQVIDAQTERELTTILTQLEEQTGIAMVIAAFPTLCLLNEIRTFYQQNPD